MSNSRSQRIAQSRYRQLRVTLTHEVSGRVSYRVHAKALNSAWSEQNLIAQGASFEVGPILSTEDAIAVLIDLLRAELLPGIG